MCQRPEDCVTNGQRGAHPSDQESKTKQSLMGARKCQRPKDSVESKAKQSLMGVRKCQRPKYSVASTLLGSTNPKGSREQASLVDESMWPTNSKRGGEQATSRVKKADESMWPTNPKGGGGQAAS